MNCAKHPDLTASAYCRTCGKALCSNCTRDVRGVIYCEECLATRLGDTIPATPQPPYATVPPVGTPVVIRQGGGSPALAAILSLIPGVGQMYNEQYAKGLIFVLVFAALIQMADHVSGLFGLLIAGFYIYQIIDAYKTADARRFGQPLPDPFGLNDMLGGKSKAAYSAPAPVYVANPSDPNAPPVAVQAADAEPVKPGAPVGAIILIGLGVLFLLDTFDFFRFDWFSRVWPVALIAIGVWIFIRRRDAAAK